MHLLLTTFALRFNGFREEHGHVFQGRYQAKRTPTGFDVSRVIDYVHLNHVRKGLLKIDELSSTPLSSLSLLVHPDRRGVFRIQEGLKYIGYPDNPDGWQAYLAHIRTVFLQDADSRLFDYEWDIAIKAERVLIDKNPSGLDRPSDLPYDQIIKLDEVYTDQVIRRLLNEAGKSEKDLLLDRGAPPWKVEIAIKILAATTASLVLVAQRLHAGDHGNLSKLMKKKGQTPLT